VILETELYNKVYSYEFPDKLLQGSCNALYTEPDHKQNLYKTVYSCDCLDITLKALPFASIQKRVFKTQAETIPWKKSKMHSVLLTKVDFPDSIKLSGFKKLALNFKTKSKLSLTRVKSSRSEVDPERDSNVVLLVRGRLPDYKVFA